MTGFADDLELARKLAAGDALAMARFEREVLPKIDAVVAKIDASPVFLDEVKQVLRERLFVTPRSIGDYSGQGPLIAWLRTAAGRIALNLLRPEKRDARAETSELDALPFAAPGPELAILKGAHQDAFRTAFQKAVASLDVRDRTALKLNALDGVPLARIATMYGCDKSTVSRWITRANEQLLERTRAALAEDLALGTAELESLIHALKSQLAQSLVQILEPPTD
ncbi:MAG: sigma-70 family RNA polymerase sigma factor [Archangium sp.]|nr:sigma-70 family RNA polymerase sigma factor [Archangium sp.]